jgi:hypothetical protein
MSIKNAVRATLCVAAVFGAGAAFAAGGNAHFIKSATSASLSGTTLNVSFKEAGLAAGSTETITLNATRAVAYECVNGGGKNPSAANKRTFQSSAASTGQFPVDQNGNLVGSLSLSAPTASELGFSCPGGQTVTLVSVTYSNVSLSDVTSGATASLGSTSYSYTNPAAP